ncbi:MULTISPECIES: hypothetical protein [Acinetobacter]|uniref:hypothetical protein n=1 Tax=Acinetobacter TaxID=469 RepID=UPI0004468700|nr:MULTISPECIES: hypothetical protein [Acinetobacter]EXD36897.1 hypothetical protein J500_0805 [Acinetobacter sp. 479375]
MKAHKFVAVHGIEKAKAVLEGAPDWAVFWISRDQNHGHIISFPNMTGHYSVDLQELKQVVESVEIVQRSGGFESVKAAITNYRASGDMVTFSSLEKRLADYELVESYKQVKVEVLDMVDVSPLCKVEGV